MNEPKLEAPGAGIPALELFVAKHFFFPKRFRSTSIEQAIAEVQIETSKILELVNSLEPQQLTERRLIPRLRGLEDSSRFWSVAMAVEHLAIVGEGMRAVLLSLANGRNELPKRGTADVKPAVDVDPANAIARFTKMSESFVRTAGKLDFEKHAELTHPHPWFGPLNARQWLMFAAPHESIHRKQIEEIIQRL